MNSEVYIETTAVIDVIFKSFPEAQVILESSDKIFTSQYSKMEIKRGFLNYLVLLYNKLVQSEDMSSVQQYVSNLNQTPRRYHLGAILDALTVFWRQIEEQRPAEFIGKYGNIPISVIIKRETESFLKIWIRRLLPKVDKMANEILNPMDCFVDIKQPEIHKGLFTNKPSTCPESVQECTIKQYFEENIVSFNKILELLEKIPSDQIDGETQKRISSLKKIIKKLPYSTRKFSNYSQDEKLCWSCGDAIQAVMAPHGVSVVNRNERHYRIICQAIGKTSLTYTSPTS